MKFDIGETVICSVEVRNAAGTLVDPTTSMNVKINRIVPFASVVSSTAMTPDTTGKYHYDFQTASLSPTNYRVIYTATDGTRITMATEEFSLE